jgi:hypothetical protein
MPFSPRDTLLPVILSPQSFELPVYAPVSDLAPYVNMLYKGGYTPDTLRTDIADLYILSFYDGQVRNGGHSQFLHNSFQHRNSNIERALRAAEMLGLKGHTETLRACAAWCDANPEEAARQNGFGIRAAALEPLDKALYAASLSEDEVKALLASLPEETRKKLAAVILIPEGAQQLADEFVAETVRLMKTMPAEDAALQAARGLRPLIEANVRKHGLWSTQEKLDEQTERESKGLARYLNKWGEKNTPEEVAAHLQTRADRFSKPEMYDRSEYHVKSWVWLAMHPALELVPPSERQVKVDAILAESPFIHQELAMRELDAVYNLLPSPEKFATSRALGQLRHKGRAPLPVGTIWSSPENTEIKQVHLLKTSGKDCFLFNENGVVTLRLVMGERKQKLIAGLARKLLAKKWISQSMATRIYRAVRIHPGPILSTAPIHAEAPKRLIEAFIPEALGMAASDKSIFADFERGVLDKYKPEKGLITWRYRSKETEVVLAADPRGVSVTIGSENHRFPIAELREWRAARLRRA